MDWALIQHFQQIAIQVCFSIFNSFPEQLLSKPTPALFRIGCTLKFF